ncbi:hypothetical protein [Luteimonas kalidii]|uniref:Uncharacterized protein n=1 Tax=Luteimonas kalidii TaxID=3042025 RepID=A0ABT6JPV5_9GAMM|nr:hypothetical protein [Luteimonas kalidii]MDH5832700.1 hypothetical protein [Luteimonas kalidii]
MSVPAFDPPAGATRYASDDASTDRVALAFADLHAALRTLGDGRWSPTYYRVADGSDWSALRDQLGQQARTAGWEPHPGLGATGTGGYPRQAWSDGRHVVAAAMVVPPTGSDGATVLMVLTPRE